MFKVDISPDVTMYNLLKSQGYDPAYALAEFIDNALQSQLERNKLLAKPQPLKINLYFHSIDYPEAELKNSIVIEDDGPGITKKKFINAMKPAKPAETKGLSEFGIGMKASAVWFTDNWKLETKPISEDFKYILNFNLSSLIINHEHTINTEEIKNQGVSGTTITLYNIRKPISKAYFELIIKDLNELYQKFTSGDGPTLILNAYFDKEHHKLVFNKKFEILNKPIYKLIKKELYAIGTPKEWKTNVSFSFQGVPIHGFICLRDPGSYSENPGLVVFRHGRVIQGLTSKKFMPLKLYKSHNKHEAQRVYGELIADDLPVTYTKDKFEIDEEAFGYELFKLQEVQELLKQSSTYRIDKGDVIYVVSEQDITKKTTNQNPTNQNPVNQNPTDQNPVNQNPTGQNPVNQNPTGQNPVNQNSTGQNPVNQNPTGQNPVNQNPTGQNPVNQNPTDQNPVNQNPTDQNPVNQNPTDQNPVNQNPIAIATLIEPQSGIQLTLLDENNSDKKKLIKSEMLIKEIETYNYCQELIKQINWIYINKKAFKEILIIALRNLLENYLDYTYGEAFPNGTAIKFEDRIKEMIDSIKPPHSLRKFETIVRSLLNSGMQGFQTQNNIYNTYFETVPRDRLIDTLHLSAHKGTNIVDLDSFILNYIKQYNMLLEVLYCIAIYHKTLSQQQTAKQA